jgi:hypothetical protein
MLILNIVSTYFQQNLCLVYHAFHFIRQEKCLLTFENDMTILFIKNAMCFREVRPKMKLLAKRRSFCKVHRVSWNIAIESKGYVKCLFQNCSYLAITVDEMIKHYGICSGVSMPQIFYIREQVQEPLVEGNC